MRAYETVIIVDSEISDEDVDQVMEKLTGIVSDLDGKFVKTEKWGRKKLAYRVKKKTKGNYLLFVFLGDLKLTRELERILKLDDRILKYLTVRLDKYAELNLLNEEEQGDGEGSEEINTEDEDDTQDEDTEEEDTEEEEQEKD